MTSANLRDLYARRPFDSAPLEIEMGQLHVPFDELTGTPSCERMLREAVERGERAALIGPSGCGKSSVTQHLLDSAPEGLAPIRVRVGLEPASVAEDPVEFARHLVHVVARGLPSGDRAVAHRASAVLRTDRPRRPVTLRASAGLGWLHGSLALELEGVTEQRTVSGNDVLEQAQQLLDVIRAAELIPLLVLDDTDHWLQGPDAADFERKLSGFFDRVLRLVAEQLDAAVVLAVHDRYLGAPAFLRAQELLGTRIDGPPLPDAPGLRRVLDRRLHLLADQAADDTIDQVLEADAVDALYERYQAHGRSLRRPLLIAHDALTVSVDAGADIVTRAHVEAAAADWDD